MKTLLVLLALFLAALFAAHATASPPPDEALMCGDTYAERHADAVQAIAAQTVYMAEWSRVMPWFEAHCRFLTELERAIRKVDDPAAFICNSRKGRPASLTTEFIAEHSAPVGIELFQEHTHLDDVCEPHDLAAGRPSLVLREATPRRVFEVYCHANDRPACVKARATMDAAAARGGST